MADFVLPPPPSTPPPPDAEGRPTSPAPADTVKAKLPPPLVSQKSAPLLVGKAPPLAPLPVRLTPDRTDSGAMMERRRKEDDVSQMQAFSERARRMTQAVVDEFGVEGSTDTMPDERVLTDDQEIASGLLFILAAIKHKSDAAGDDGDLVARSRSESLTNSERADGESGAEREKPTPELLLRSQSSPNPQHASPVSPGHSSPGSPSRVLPSSPSRARSSMTITRTKKKQNRNTFGSFLKKQTKDKSNVGLTLSEPPKYFIEYLSGTVDPSAVPILISLAACIDSQGSKWVQKFMSLKPIPLLYKLLQPAVGARIPGVSEVMNATMDVLVAIGRHPAFFVKVAGDNNLQHLVRLLPVNELVSQNAARALYEMLKVDGSVGYIVAAFEAATPPRPRTGKYMQASGVYAPIGQAMTMSATASNRVHLLTFLNQFISKVDERIKVALIYDLLAEGLGSMMIEWRDVDLPMFRIQLDLFSDYVRSVSQKLWTTVDRSKLPLDPTSDPEPEGRLSIVYPFADVPPLVFEVPEKGVRVAALLEGCAAAHSLSHSLFKQQRATADKYGLFDRRQRQWLSPLRLLRKEEAAGLELEFKHLPWKVVVQHPTQDRTIRINVCPQVTVDVLARSVLGDVMEEEEIEEDLEYGLFVDATNKWLEGPDLLAHPEYADSEKAPPVRIRMKPVLLKCSFQEQSIEVAVSDEDDVRHFRSVLGDTLAIGEHSLERYAIYVQGEVDECRPMQGRLDLSESIQSLRKRHGLSCQYSLIVGPEPVTLCFAPSLLESAKLDRGDADGDAKGSDEAATAGVEEAETNADEQKGQEELAEGEKEEAPRSGTPQKPAGMSDEMWELQKLEMEFSELENNLEAIGQDDDASTVEVAAEETESTDADPPVGGEQLEGEGTGESGEGAEGEGEDEGEGDGAVTQDGQGSGEKKMESREVHLFLRASMTDTTTAISEALGISPAGFFLHILSEDDTSTPALPWSSLADQGFGQSSRLLLVAKSGEEVVDADEVAVNIWEEETNDETFSAKTTEDGKTEVLLGTLNQLVKHLTNPIKYDSKFLNTFIQTYRSFASPETLFRKLMERYRVPDTVDEKEKSVVQMRVLVVLKLWIQKFNSDAERQLFGQITEFIEETKDQALKNTVLKQQKKKEHQYYFNEPPPPSIVPKTKPSLMNLDPLEVARQLTLIEFDIFSKLRPIEFFKQAWCSKKYQHLAPNLLGIIDHFNKISRWVSSRVVIEKEVRNRVKVMEQFIFIADQCKKLNSFHLLIAMISGLNNSSILRLKWTKQRLSKRAMQVLHDLEAFTNMEGSYRIYRNAVVLVKPPCIPYMGVYLQDLTFIEDGNPDVVNGLINFAKRTMVFKILDQISTIQQDGYNLAVVEDMRYYLSHLPQLSDKDLYRMSLSCEPRGASAKDIM